MGKHDLEFLLSDAQRKARKARHVYLLRFEWGEVMKIGRHTIEGARKIARREARVGWNEVDKTHWVDVDLCRYARFGTDRKELTEVETVTEAIHPAEPKCPTLVTHNWIDGIAVGNNCGGTLHRDYCSDCYLVRYTDTRPQRPDNGQDAPTESIRYETP